MAVTRKPAAVSIDGALHERSQKVAKRRRFNSWSAYVVSLILKDVEESEREEAEQAASLMREEPAKYTTGQDKVPAERALLESISQRLTEIEERFSQHPSFADLKQQREEKLEEKRAREGKTKSKP